jgi:hypothetical protein
MSLGTSASNGPTVPVVGQIRVASIFGMVTGKEKLKHLEETLSSVALWTTDPVRITLGLKPVLRVQRSATRRLRHAGTSVLLCLISGFRSDVDQVCGLLGYYAAQSGNSIPTFRDNPSVSSSRVKKFKKSIDIKVMFYFLEYLSYNYNYIIYYIIKVEFENCALLSHYAANSGNSLPNFRDNLSVSSSRVKILTLEDGANILSRSVGEKLHSALRNVPEERSSCLHRGGSLRPRKVRFVPL